MSRPRTPGAGSPGAVVVGAYLRALRESTIGLHLLDVTSAAGYRSTKTVLRMERAETRQRFSVIVALLRLYEVWTPQEEQAVLDLVRQGDQPLDKHGASARDRLASCWCAAEEIRTSASRWLPPSVQSTAYAAEYAKTHPAESNACPDFPEPAAGRLLTLLVNEDILTRPVGGPEAMARQLARLQDLILEGILVLRIVPASVQSAVPRSLTQFDLNGQVRLYAEELPDGVRYSPGPEPGAALDRLEAGAYSLAVGYDRLEAARAAFAEGRS
ncbi:Scr1 family TA system antitoxin-like transcriptional regulator [Streptomyces niveus]|uniref:Scr1 family TA system antitoxin-like transcriptional regulator n=1 Tax=Streptomyces niveus TaxID=193462 RepID=UPI0036BB5BE2